MQKPDFFIDWCYADEKVLRKVNGGFRILIQAISVYQYEFMLIFKVKSSQFRCKSVKLSLTSNKHDWSLL